MAKYLTKTQIIVISVVVSVVLITGIGLLIAYLIGWRPGKEPLATMLTQTVINRANTYAEVSRGRYATNIAWSTGALDTQGYKVSISEPSNGAELDN